MFQVALDASLLISLLKAVNCNGASYCETHGGGDRYRYTHALRANLCPARTFWGHWPRIPPTRNQGRNQGPQDPRIPRASLRGTLMVPPYFEVAKSIFCLHLSNSTMLRLAHVDLVFHVLGVTHTKAGQKVRSRAFEIVPPPVPPLLNLVQYPIHHIIPLPRTKVDADDFALLTEPFISFPCSSGGL